MAHVKRLVFGVLALSLLAAPAFAQGASSASSLTGVVVDKDGGVVPGATVVVKNMATAVSQTTTTNSSGVYAFPTMTPGTYTVTITLQGFKTHQINEVRLLAGTPANLGKATLEIGALTETVEVRGSTDLVRTASPTVSNTVSTEFITNLPRSDRNVLSFLIFLPGVQTSGGAGNSRSSTIAGLPQNTINISIDGVTTSNLLQSGDGFFTLITPRPDTVEEVTLTTAAAGADSTGQGTSQVKFVTRSGTNQYSGSGYTYYKNKALNSNTFFNYNVNKLPRPISTTKDFGSRVGGPIQVPGLWDGHGKAFFFFNMEEIRTPNSTARSRTILKQSAFAGDFTYNNNSPRTVNVLDLALANGQLTTIDPTIATLIAKMRAASLSTGNIQFTATSPNTETFNYQIPVDSHRHSPTGRADVNLTSKHRLSGVYYWERVYLNPDTLNNADPSFPGFPAQAGQYSYRTSGSSTLRSTLSTNMVNEVIGGWQWSPVDFFGDASPSYFTDPKANQDGYAMSLGFGLTNAAPGNASSPEQRNTANYNIDDNLNWLRGDHSLKFGFSWTRITNWLVDSRIVPQVSIGLTTNNTTDPALSMFNTTNFATANSTDLNNARALYALLTGRISQLPGTGQLTNDGTKYIFNGPARDSERQDAYGLYAQDSWRWKPNLTITAGLRYQLQMPMIPTIGRMTGSQLKDVCGMSGIGDGIGGRQCNLFKPGFVGDPTFTASTFAPLTANTKGYNLDRNNFAPNIGANWRPMVQNGFLRKILGDPEQATVSGGYSRTFNFERVDRFLDVYNGNPGQTTPATRGFASTNFLLCDGSPGDPCPVLFSQKNRLGQPPFQQAPTFPLTATSSQSVFVFDQNIQVPYTDSWTVGLQRSVTRDMAVEVRYIGNQNQAPWNLENWNAANYRETGLVGKNAIDNIANQFALAQANLRANIVAGNGSTFAYTGAPGTSPLPLFLAHFVAGMPASAASNPLNYTGTQWTNSTWVDSLNPFSPRPDSIAGNLWTGNNGVWKANAIDSGIYPANFWVMNPAVNQAQVQRNLGSSKYNSMQVEVRRRFAQGLQAQMSYTYARGTNYNSVDLHRDLLTQRSTTIPHAIKMLWAWELPVGRGKRFGTNWSGLMDGALGGWQFSGGGRIQVPLFRLQNTLIKGMSQKDAQDIFKRTRVEVTTAGAVTVWNMPKDVVDQTILAYSTSLSSPGYFTAGAPSGRYFAPARRPGPTAGDAVGNANLASVYGANDPGCFGLFARDCAPDLFFYGNWFGEFDFRLAKKFKLPGRATFEMSAEVFNALKATNFSNVLSIPDGNNINNTFRITGQGSAARTAQLVWRVNW